MTMIATTEERWLSSPLVQYAVEKSGTEAPAVEILSTLSDLLNELEERCPGVPFSSILGGAKADASFEDKHTSMTHLLSMGLAETTVYDLLELEAEVKEPVERQAATWHLSVRIPNTIETFARDRDAGLTHKAIAKKWGVTPRTVFRYLAQQKLTELVAS